ncbi:DUF3565 domain-containing protein [Candidatus Colwellia aromaticivorans]|uniref:DUF3565 domain-containing protein n=1 Tax=Candidatus Colwellia aromaticivorans TaxID=2267621 RepID=UPI000DF28F56|nr:DUF3565 domain-containing protein [Candidatus Colwellia aromaticivorans]
MNQSITGYHKDDENDWVAELLCGHFQHIRNNPPFINRPWVTTQVGRCSMIGYELNCKKCDSGEPQDVIYP